MSPYPTTKAQVRARDGYRCVLCGTSDRLTLHHVRPKAIGGSGRPRNLVTLCAGCHTQLEHPIRNAFAWLASVLVWLLCGPILTIARLTAPLRWRVATLYPNSTRLEINQ